MMHTSLNEKELPNVVAGVLNSEQYDLVDEINRRAACEYLRVKTEKKKELSKFEKVITKARKKQIANHASAVASRSRGQFLQTAFSQAIRTKTSEALYLVNYVRQLSQQVATLRRSVDNANHVILQQGNELRCLREQVKSSQPTVQNNPPCSQNHLDGKDLVGVEEKSEQDTNLATPNTLESPVPYEFPRDPLEEPLALSDSLFGDPEEMENEGNPQRNVSNVTDCDSFEDRLQL